MWTLHKPIVIIFLSCYFQAIVVEAFLCSRSATTTGTSSGGWNTTGRCPAATADDSNGGAKKEDDGEDVYPVASSLETKTRQDYDAAWSTANLNECAELWELSQPQCDHLQSLQNRLMDLWQHPLNEPFVLVRFLLDNYPNVQLAETKFRAMIQWRLEKQIDALVVAHIGRNTPGYSPPPLFRYFPGGLLEGLDKDGDPIHLERTGIADTYGLLQRYGRAEMVRYSTWFREVQSYGAWRDAYEHQQGHKVKQITLLFDLKGLTSAQLKPILFSVGQEISRLTQDYYPHATKRIIFLQTPPIFAMVWKVFKPFIAKRVQKQMIFTTPRNYQQVLEEYMDPKVLPSAVHPLGEGRAMPPFDPVWEGGPIPVEHEASDHQEEANEIQELHIQDEGQPQVPSLSTAQTETSVDEACPIGAACREPAMDTTAAAVDCSSCSLRGFQQTFLVRLVRSVYRRFLQTVLARAV